MGMFDTVKIDGSIELPEVDGERITARSWQTKELGRMMSKFRITSEGRLQQKETHMEDIPKEEQEAHGCGFTRTKRRVEDGWSTRDSYHGDLELHRTTEFGGSSYVSLTARFTHGELEEIWVNKVEDIE